MTHSVWKSRSLAAILVVAVAVASGFALRYVTASRAALTPAEEESESQEPDGMNPGEREIATFGGGCFWCTEAVFQEVRGVHSVVSGYSGGDVENPTYEQVCRGTTGHAEVIQIEFDPEQVDYETLLRVFFYTHDPTTLNRQGNDVGTQYRSVVFYHDDDQRETAERVKRELDDSGDFLGPIVTQVDPLETFYEAEDYHQDYFSRNANQPYCAVVIGPKLDKFRHLFEELKK